MNWYLAKVVFRIICGDGQHAAQFDEQMRLVQAHNERSAIEKAGRMGLAEQDTFYNQQEKLVQWQFLAVTELHCLNDWVDGAEICSRIHEEENAMNYTNFVLERAAFLCDKYYEPSMITL